MQYLTAQIGAAIGGSPIQWLLTASNLNAVSSNVAVRGVSSSRCLL